MRISVFFSSVNRFVQINQSDDVLPTIKGIKVAESVMRTALSLRNVLHFPTGKKIRGLFRLFFPLKRPSPGADK